MATSITGVPAPAAVTGFFQTTRGPELVFLPDNDVVGFFPNLTVGAATQGMNIYRGSNKTSTLYASSSQYDVLEAVRVLCWGRVSGISLVTGPRWVPFVNADTVDSTDIRPLIEVFSPRVVYEKDTNVIHLWFWTNFKTAYTGTTYDIDELYRIGITDYDDFALAARRALCYTTGHFVRGYVDGGYLGGNYSLSGDGFADETNDLVPVFQRPKIVQYAGSDTPGIITDGWYLGGSQGTQGPIGPYGPAGTQGPQGTQGPIGPYGPKAAILSTKEGYREVACIESPEVLFFDVMEFSTSEWDGMHRVCEVDIDPIFLEIVEDGTLKVLSVVPNEITSFSAKIIKGKVIVETSRSATGHVMIAGVRKGFLGHRFTERTKEQFERNVAFWGGFYDE